MTEQVWPFLPHLPAIGALWQTTLDNVELYHSKFELKKDSALCSCITYYREMHGGCVGVYIVARVYFFFCCHIFLNFGVTKFTLMRLLEMPISFSGLFSCFGKLFSPPLEHLYFLFSSCLIKFGVRIFRVFILQTYPFFSLSLSCRNFLISKSVLFCVCKLIAARFFYVHHRKTQTTCFFSRYCWP